MYLGLPITDNKRTCNQWWKLIQPTEKLLAKWSGRCLSYEGKIQLVNWVIAGMYSYRVQAPRNFTPRFHCEKSEESCLPIHLEGKEGYTLATNGTSKNESALGVRSLPIITKVVDIKSTANFWSSGPSILANWIKDRYIRNQIIIRPTVDSTYGWAGSHTWEPRWDGYGLPHILSQTHENVINEEIVSHHPTRLVKWKVIGLVDQARAQVQI